VLAASFGVLPELGGRVVRFEHDCWLTHELPRATAQLIETATGLPVLLALAYSRGFSWANKLVLPHQNTNADA